MTSSSDGTGPPKRKHQNQRQERRCRAHVIKEKRQHTYDVLWDCGRTERVSARSIALETAYHATETPTDTTLESFVDARISAQSVNEEVGETFSCTSSSDEDDEDIYCASATNSDAQMRLVEQVECHGRQWVFCKSVYNDLGARKCFETRFKWPSVLDLGDKTYSKYFYLMCPMEYMVSVVHHTNKNLDVNQQARTSTGDGLDFV